MKKQRKFLVGGLTVAGIVGYLMATGMKDSMVYYHTPAELVSKLAADPSYREVGVRVGGRIAPGTVKFDQRTLDLHFVVADIQTPDRSFPVHYQGPLPETFEEGRDVVVEGKVSETGTLEATTVLTKCGSRYEATAEDFQQ